MQIQDDDTCKPESLQVPGPLTFPISTGLQKHCLQDLLLNEMHVHQAHQTQHVPTRMSSQCNATCTPVMHAQPRDTCLHFVVHHPPTAHSKDQGMHSTTCSQHHQPLPVHSAALPVSMWPGPNAILIACRFHLCNVAGRCKSWMTPVCVFLLNTLCAGRRSISIPASSAGLWLLVPVLWRVQPAGSQVICSLAASLSVQACTTRGLAFRVDCSRQGKA
jgi:hypothetical protein